MKKVFKKIHLWLSIPVGIIISIICFTGASLVFQQDITEALNPELYKVERKGNATPLPPSVLLQKIQGQIPDTLVVGSIELSASPERPCMISFKNLRRKSLSVNPYTGQVLGWTKSYPFFRTMLELHRWLMDVPAKKGASTVGKTVVGISTLFMAVILITGIIIWWPKTRKMLAMRLKVAGNKGGYRFWYDSHVSLGIYATIFLLLMSLTGLTWSFKWYRNAFYCKFNIELQFNGQV